jgi:aldehyde:ferredoxin oxidoreductase
MSKVVLIDLKDYSHTEIEIELTNPLVPISLPLLSVLAKKVKKQNFFIISKGILGGKNGVGLADAVITAISPQSGGVIEAKIQGALANALYSIKIDALAFINKSKELVGAEIYGGKFLEFEFPSAKHLAGKSVWQTDQAVRGDNSLSVLAISGYGENQVAAASVVSDNGFATAQGGIGAILGRMNLKYVNLKGDRDSYLAPVVGQVTKKYIQGMSSNPLTKSELEAPGFGLWANKNLVGYMAGNNFGISLPKAVDHFDPTSFLPYLKDDGGNSCPGCPQNCLKSYLTVDAPINGGRQHQLSVTAFLSQFGEGNTERLIELNSYCHEAGLEHIYIAALFTQEKIKSSKSVKKMINKVATKPLKKSARLIKNMAIPPWDPRGSQGLFLAMALNPSGPRYDVIEHDIDFDPQWAWQRHVDFGVEYGIPVGGLKLGTLDKNREKSIGDLWLLWSALDAIGVCIYAAPPTRELQSSDILALLTEATKIKFNLNDLFNLGLIRLAIQRDVNHKLGLTNEEDDLPKVFFKQGIEAKGAKLDKVLIDRSEFEKMKKAIIKRLLWRSNGGVDKSSNIWKQCQVEIKKVESMLSQL